jgi:hypothetical protein
MRGVLQPYVLAGAAALLSAAIVLADDPAAREKPVSPQEQEIVPAPVIPDQMAVPAPTAKDPIQKAPEYEVPPPHGAAPKEVPPKERRDVTPAPGVTPRGQP